VQFTEWFSDLDSKQKKKYKLTLFQQCKVFMAEAKAELPTSFVYKSSKDFQVKFTERFSDLDSKQKN